MNNPCEEIPLPIITATQRPHRFTTFNGVDIAMDYENEGYELTRIVMVEKISKPELSLQRWLKMWNKMVIAVAENPVPDIVVAIHKRRPEPGEPTHLMLTKNYNTEYE